MSQTIQISVSAFHKTRCPKNAPRTFLRFFKSSGIFKSINKVPTGLGNPESMNIEVSGLSHKRIEKLYAHIEAEQFYETFWRLFQ